MGITAEQVRAIKDWAKATKHVGEVRLYGSQATGLATDKSDIDLASSLPVTILLPINRSATVNDGVD
jgi:predicted nucleotidyltransferase